jgi:RNA 3'-terminal phosphate cyclase (ATP)
VSRLISIDGDLGEGGGQIVRTALALSAVTGQGFEMARIRAGRLRPGLEPAHVAAVRAAAMICQAKVGGAFEGSPDLRFEPGALAPGEFRFEIGAAGAVTLVLETVLAPLATAGAPSVIEIAGGTHVPASPSFHYLARHLLPLLERLGLRARAELVRAGFHPKGGGEVRATVEPWVRPASLQLDARGRLLALRGVSGASRLKGGVAERQRDAAAEHLWESRRIKAEWETIELPSASPGSFVVLEAIYEGGSGAVGRLGERGLRPEAVGAAAAREALRFLEGTGAVDGPAADQLLLPLALAGGGGRVTTSEITEHLETVARIVGLFGFGVRLEGLRGGAGVVEVDPH